MRVCDLCQGSEDVHEYALTDGEPLPPVSTPQSQMSQPIESPGALGKIELDAPCRTAIETNGVIVGLLARYGEVHGRAKRGGGTLVDAPTPE